MTLLTPAPLRDLILAVRAVYFEQMKRGEKLEEFRLQNAFWAKRRERKNFARVLIYWGYPAADDLSRRLVFAWRGFSKRELQHEHFGPEPVKDYAIAVHPYTVVRDGLRLEPHSL